MADRPVNGRLTQPVPPKLPPKMSQTDPNVPAEGDSDVVSGQFARPLFAFVRENKALVWTIMASMLLHGAGLAVGALRDSLTPDVNIEFDATEHLALMDRLGLVEHGEGSEMPVDLTEIPEETAEPALPEPEPEPEPEEELDAGTDTSDDDAAPEPEPEPQPELSDAGTIVAAEPEERPDAERPSRDAERDRPSRRDATRDEPREEEGSARDNADDVPAQRYPEGVLHPVATDVGMWGPEGARMVVVLRTDRIRRSVHRDTVATLFSALPDWQALVGGAEIDIFREVDALMIASTDPRYVGRTFLAAVHRIDPSDILDRLASGYPYGVRWSVTEDGRIRGDQVNPVLCPTRTNPERVCDPRVFFVPTRDLFVFTRPEYIEPLLADVPTAEGLDESFAYVEDPDAWRSARDGSGEGSGATRDGTLPPIREGTGSTEGTGSATGTGGRTPTTDGRPNRRANVDNLPPVRGEGWITGLRELADFGGTGSDGPAMVGTFQGFSEFSIDSAPNVTAPQSIHVSIYATDDPLLAGRFVFSEPAQAEAWIAAWPDVLGEFRTQLAIVGMYRPLRDAEWNVDHNEAIFRAMIPRSTLEQAAMAISLMMAD